MHGATIPDMSSRPFAPLRADVVPLWNPGSGFTACTLLCASVRIHSCRGRTRFSVFSATLWRGHMLLMAPVVYYFGVFLFHAVRAATWFCYSTYLLYLRRAWDQYAGWTWTTLKQKAIASLESTPIAVSSKSLAETAGASK